MTGLDLAGDEELSSAFEPCLKPIIYTLREGDCLRKDAEL